jgi:hypothetical protein
MLIFVFAGLSCGLTRAILAEFAPVPNAPSDVETTRLPTTEIAAQPPMARPVRVSPVALANPLERGGPGGPEPTRYGDWERNGRCVDF